VTVPRAGGRIASTMTFTKAYGVENTEGEVLNMLGTDIRVLAGRRTGSSFSLMTCRLPPGQGPPPHIHDDEDEAFYVLEGQMRFKAGTDEWVLGPGSFVYLPRGLIHQPMVEGEHPATVLAVLSRPGLEDFFAEFSSELAKSGRAPTLELLDRVGVSYGLRHFPRDQARPGGGSFYRHQDTRLILEVRTL
jgi:quercetin dioxygenase-like cupin family protein